MSRPMSIVVTVGTTRTPFPELFEWVETHCQQHTVFVQHGPYNPPQRHLTSYVEFLPHAELLEKMKAADIIIAHGGIHTLPTAATTMHILTFRCGTVVEVLRLGKPLIASPNPRFPDNHHVEMCEVFVDSCWVVNDEEEFVEALEEVIKFVNEGEDD